MTELEQNRAIAEACGFEDISESYGVWVGVARSASNRMALVLPDYLHDLNAMHAALTEQLLSDGSWARYRKHLCDLCNLGTEMHDECAWMITHNATAAQRAGAFLRTIGKWKETP